MDAVTLEEIVAEKMARLLIEAARARETAAPADRAAELESEAIKWERRLNWWKHLRERKSSTP
jgi:hypothetical protein